MKISLLEEEVQYWTLAVKTATLSLKKYIYIPLKRNIKYILK